MTTYIGPEESTVEKILFGAVVASLVLLFVVMIQPVFHREEMVAELKSDCKKVGGVMLEHERMFGTSYECAERKD